jgi:hypothetical protein
MEQTSNLVAYLRTRSGGREVLTPKQLEPIETFPTKYHLSDFTEYFDLPEVRWVKPDAEKCEIRGRNDELFHTLRLWAYKAVKEHSNEDMWCQTALGQAEAINASFQKPLHFNEVKTTAKSVSAWVWKNRNELSGRAKVLIQRCHFKTSKQCL